MMKKQIKGVMTIAMFGAMVGLLTGCVKKETETVVQPEIVNQVNLTGFAPGIQCATCHDPSADTVYYVAAREFQYEQSVHYTGGESERNSSSCAGCHTTEGFVQRMNGEAVTDQPESTPPGCFACHSPHERANFTLRDSTPVTFVNNLVGLQHTAFDYGHGNLCVKCHQPRPLSGSQANPAKIDSMITITSNRWNEHYGVQGEMLLGKGDGGFEYPGVSYTNSPHTGVTKNGGCVECHMAEGVYPPTLGTGKAGGHTLNIVFTDEGSTQMFLAGCNQTGCHNGALTTTDYKGYQTIVSEDLDTLQNLLAAKGWIDTTQMVVNASSSQPLKITMGQAGAIWNFFFVLNDGSKGVHNSQYAMQLLRSSLDEMEKP
jgi:hypothetical protein